MEFMPNFRLHRPAQVADALVAKAEEDSLYVAGGTDMLVNVRRGIEQPKHLVDLSAVNELKTKRVEKDELVLGSGLTLVPPPSAALLSSVSR